MKLREDPYVHKENKKGRHESHESHESRTATLLQERRGPGRCRFGSGSFSSAAKEGRVISTPNASHVFRHCFNELYELTARLLVLVQRAALR